MSHGRIAVADLDAAIARIAAIRRAAERIPPAAAIVDRHGAVPADSQAVAAHWSQRERRLSVLAELAHELLRDVERFADEAGDAVVSLVETDRVLAEDLTRMVRQLDDHEAARRPR